MEPVQRYPDRGSPHPVRRAFPATAAAVSAGQADRDGWTAAAPALACYRPGRVFSDAFLDTFLG